jgi:hypothetical protein
VDWLGLSRLGSPDTGLQDDDESDENDPLAGKKGNQMKKTEKRVDSMSADTDDWLSNIQSKPEHKDGDDQVPVKDETRSDDYLGLGGDIDLDDLMRCASSCPKSFTLKHNCSHYVLQ